MPMLAEAAETVTVPEAVRVPEKVLLPVKVWVPARIASSEEVFGRVKLRGQVGLGHADLRHRIGESHGGRVHDRGAPGPCRGRADVDDGG